MLLNLLKAIGTWFLFIIPAFILVPYALFDCCRWSFKIDENKRLGLDIDERGDPIKIDPEHYAPLNNKED